MTKWIEVAKNDVINAIEIFERDNPTVPSAQNTFLIYNGKKYPAKHIRGMAYEVAFGTEIRKSEYSGGLETVLFFKNLGFHIAYTGVNKQLGTIQAIVKPTMKEIKKPTILKEPIKVKVINKKIDSIKLSSNVTLQNNETVKTLGALKIGLYLQDRGHYTSNDFVTLKKEISMEHLDLFVFPENCYVPFLRSVTSISIGKPNEYELLKEACNQLSKELGCPLIYSGKDLNSTLFSLYVNPIALEGETEHCLYIKHTATAHSAFDMNYQKLMTENFPVINLKSVKIGMTICYDCNHALFSRVYGLKGIDILINSTGGNVVRTKWHRYNKVRAIENHCFSLCTMGYSENETNPSYTFAFTPSGKALKYDKCIGMVNEANTPGNVYSYTVEIGNDGQEEDITLSQKETLNKNGDYAFCPSELNNTLIQSTKIETNLYVLQQNDKNVVICLLDNEAILQPDVVCQYLYNDKLKSLKNKKYLIINRWSDLNDSFYKNVLSDVLKVRATENFVGVVLISQNYVKCYQSGNIKNVQLVEAQKNIFKMDLSRMGGPESIWKQEKTWRAGYELLLKYMDTIKALVKS